MKKTIIFDFIFRYSDHIYIYIYIYIYIKYIIDIRKSSNPDDARECSNPGGDKVESVDSESPISACVDQSFHQVAPTSIQNPITNRRSNSDVVLQ